MKNKLLALLFTASLPAFAVDSIVLEDYDYTITGNIAINGSSNYIAAFWGTYDTNTKIFTPISGTGVNAGYFGLNGDDALVSYAATTNGGVASSTVLSLGLFDISNTAQFSAVTESTKRLILTDPSWIAPTFNTSPGQFAVSFTPSTTAAVGTYTYVNATLQTLALVAPTASVPEPSSFAALAGLATLGFAAARRRRA